MTVFAVEMVHIIKLMDKYDLVMEMHFVNIVGITICYYSNAGRGINCMIMGHNLWLNLYFPLIQGK